MKTKKFSKADRLIDSFIAYQHAWRKQPDNTPIKLIEATMLL